MKCISGGANAWDIEASKEAVFQAAEMMEQDPVIAIPREMVMVGRALGTLGGMFFEHKPDLDPMRMMMPIIGAIA